MTMTNIENKAKQNLECKNVFGNLLLTWKVLSQNFYLFKSSMSILDYVVRLFHSRQHLEECTESAEKTRILFRPLFQ